MLAYPFRPTVIGWVVGLSLAALLPFALSGVFLLNWMLAAAWWVMAFKLATEGLLDGAQGREIDARSERFVEDAQAVRHIVLWFLLALLGGFAWALGDAGGLLLFGIATTPVLPAAILLVAMEDSLLRGLDPRAWFEVIRRIGPDYLLMAAKIAGLCVALVLLEWVLLPRLPGWLGVPVSRFVLLVLLFSVYHALGVLLHGHRDALERIDERAIIPPVLTTPEEDLAIREAGRLVSEDQPAPAAAVLDRIIRGQGAAPPVHARYRELLTLAGDRAGLLRHARDYVAVLLTLGKEREALALYLTSRAEDTGFELEEPQMVSDLIALAARNQQSLLAVTLAAEFARRFPRDRDLVLNGLTAAKLMDRLDRDDQAQRLLSDLLQRFPEHALVEQLQAALQALDAVSPAPRRQP